MRARWTGGLAGALLGVAAAGAALAYVLSERTGPERPAPLSAERAAVAARLAEAAAADAGAAWRVRFREELGRGYAPAELRLFARRSADACAGGAEAAGAFYCAERGALAVDLATLEGLRVRMRREGELAVALFVGRATAVQAVAELGFGGAAAGDCLAGVWAAGSGLRGASAEVYARMLAAAEEAARAERAGRARLDAALFAPGVEGVRKDAFARGLAAGALSDCAP